MHHTLGESLPPSIVGDPPQKTRGSQPPKPLKQHLVQERPERATRNPSRRPQSICRRGDRSQTTRQSPGKAPQSRSSHGARLNNNHHTQTARLATNPPSTARNARGTPRKV